MKRIFIIAFHFLILATASINASDIKHVVVIGCDGFGAYAYHKADMPNLKNLASQGAWSVKSRSVLPSSSAVNWASILMSASPTIHGYTEWGSQTPEIPSAVISQYGKFPSIYTILKEQKPEAKTAAIYSWQGIEHLLEKEIIDYLIPTKSNEDLTADTAAYIIKNHKPAFTFIHFDEPDHTGHKIGHDTPEYYEMLKKVDERIGRIVQAVKDAGIASQTVIMVVADHGGIDKGHGKKSMQEVEIPIVVHGPGIKKGHEIEGVIVDYDYAATIAKIFGLQCPQAWRGKAIDDAFEK
ncbi:alkaline phosphatase [Dysgonomonas sp. 511]|uniref:alkaline phosphatase n=1 Tax=Dysgonomonas sp. 511 TaxID=2302930 RepID=UPI0013D4F551|nr:alkaline phosphatase [Dysgonomonas sp. 511]NDV80028.1 alkaline phosphatase [Dysgonomonas sp. 511]